MVKQWKRSLSQSDILSDGQPFDGANIDAPISEAGADLEWKGAYRYIEATDNGTITLDNNNQTLATQGVDLSPNDDYLFVVDESSSKIIKYSITNYDLDSLEQVQSKDISGDVGTQPTGLRIGGNGNYLYISDRDNSDILKYDFGTTLDLSTLSFDVGPNFNNPDDIQGFCFGNDGSKLYIGDNNGGRVWEYSLSTDYKITINTYSYSNRYTDVSILPSSLSISPNGKRLLVIGENDSYEYYLSQPFELGKTKSIFNIGYGGFGATISNNGYYQINSQNSANSEMQKITLGYTGPK